MSNLSPEVIAYAVKGSNGERYVELMFENALVRARKLAQKFPEVLYSVVELYEQPSPPPRDSRS